MFCVIGPPQIPLLNRLLASQDPKTKQKKTKKIDRDRDRDRDRSSRKSDREPIPRRENYLDRDMVRDPVERAEPPSPPAPSPPQPLKLTNKEKKTLRANRRFAKEKYRLEMIRRLLQSPKPKSKLIKLPRFEAIQDQDLTRLEMELEMEVRSAATERTLRCPAMVAKYGPPNPSNPNEHGKAVDPEVGGDDRALLNNSSNHDSVVVTVGIVAEDITDVQHAMEEDCKGEM